MKKLLLTGILIVCVFLLGGCQNSGSIGNQTAEKNSSTVSQSDKSDTSKQDDKSAISKSEPNVSADAQNNQDSVRESVNSWLSELGY